MPPTWYIDFEGYHYENRFIVKEIAILNKDTQQCYNYFVTNPCTIPNRPLLQSINFQYKRHNLRWRFGDYLFLDAIADIMAKVKGDAVYAKGSEKVKFLQTWLPQTEEMTWITTSFNKLYNCVSEVCEIGHGLNCARRKVHELRHADCLYKSLIIICSIE